MPKDTDVPVLVQMNLIDSVQSLCTPCAMRSSSCGSAEFQLQCTKYRDAFMSSELVSALRRFHSEDRKQEDLYYVLLRDEVAKFLTENGLTAGKEVRL